MSSYPRIRTHRLDHFVRRSYGYICFLGFSLASTSLNMYGSNDTEDHPSCLRKGPCESTITPVSTRDFNISMLDSPRTEQRSRLYITARLTTVEKTLPAARQRCKHEIGGFWISSSFGRHRLPRLLDSAISASGKCPNTRIESAAASRSLLGSMDGDGRHRVGVDKRQAGCAFPSERQWFT